MFSTILVIALATIQSSIPLLFAGFAGLFSERSGVVNIALEGFLLLGAFSGAAIMQAMNGSSQTLYITAGFLGTIVAGALLALLFAVVVITLKADQIVSGVAINIFVGGLTVILSQAFFTARSFNFPEVPVFIKTYFFPILALLIAAVTYFVLYKTRFGLRLRAVGENPLAADTLGVNVVKMRYIAVIISGVLATFGGAYISIFAGSFAKDMSAGRGYIALAALIFGKWKPKGVFFAALIFGFFKAIEQFLQGGVIPTQFIQMIPYLMTIITLAGFIGRATPPAADGIPYEKELSE